MKQNTFYSELRSSLIVTVGLVMILCVAYPIVVWGISQLIFPHQANGSLIRNTQGEVVGSLLIAQAFDDSVYFHPRPSAAGSGYDAANSSGSNLGPLSQKLGDQLQERIARYRTSNGISPSVKIPVDAVTASASGLDPHISPANASLQAARVARARGLNLLEVTRLVQENTNRRQLGVLGEEGVNVLGLNMALDRIKP